MNEKVIWDYLLKSIGNAYGAAAVMGNLMAESSLNPKNVTGVKDPDYVSKADAGTIDFVHDGHAFGLVQWCFWSRKEGLFNYAKSRGVSVGDLNMQLEYAIKELSTSYKTVWAAITGAKDIRTASDVVMLKYEKPSNTSEAMKQRRADYGQKFYDAYASSTPVADKTEPKPVQKKVVIKVDRVNLRAGNGTSFARITQVNKNTMYEWVATSENGWYAVRIPGKVVWVSCEFAEMR